MATIGHMMTQIMKNKAKMVDPVKLVTFKQFCQVSLDTSLGHVSNLLDMDHFVLVVHNQRMGKQWLHYLALRALEAMSSPPITSAL